MYRILIVDDEADIALILKLQLEDAGYTTVRARDGLQAMEILSRDRDFAAILLDIKMPWMDGIQVLENVSRHYAEIPVVMMTAHGSENIAVDAMKKGASDYISKPFNTDELLKNVQRVIEVSRTRQENQRLQRQVDEERLKTEAILQGMADILVAVDEAGRIMSLNRRAETVLGIGREEAKGKPVQEVLSSSIPVEELPCMQALRSGGEKLDVEYRLRTPQREVPVLSSATPLLDADGKLTGSVEIIRDISTLKALEQEKQDFVSMLSHDLKTPITAVVGSIDLVREGRLGTVNEEQKEYLDSAIESCEEMVGMIDNLLDVQRFQAGKMVLWFREEDPRALVERVITRFRPLARRSEIQLYGSFGDPLPPVTVDRSKFLRLLNNLVSNSMKFTPEGGEIEISVAAADIGTFRHRIPSQMYDPSQVPLDGNFLAVTVRDSGIGIPQEALSVIFDRFEQGGVRAKMDGTGLGLTFCKKVADAHRGYIWSESEMGKGSRFTLLLPLDRPA
ncbi:MAG TPA: response regulator [Verrucomicrobiae bacterium]|nr:response regulator [Verrucomicrobiae bacterium]